MGGVVYWGTEGVPHEGAFGATASISGIPLEPLVILLVDVTMQSHSGHEYMGLVPRLVDKGFGF